jgi:4-aminobutyrate aminotransferase-like enzyme
VGHGHPTVVAAIADQAARLNTNTRYVTDIVNEYAERLTGLLPDPLDTVVFANGGGEANDLAWRLAQTVTTRRGAIVTANAYHGATDLTMATSPEGLAETGAPIPDWVATIPIPSALETPSLEPAIEQLGRADHRPAFLAVDTIFSSDGVHPAGFSLVDLAADVRRAGGLFIADEVQAGFGRVGTQWWGFRSAEVVPDIVTLGKPMGNGQPLAAMVTRRDLAEEFASRGYYFSTFAGNPVSIAAGAAMLDVMEAEGLAERADTVGDGIRSAIRSIPDARLGEVRGIGQFTGVDIVDGSGAPDPITAEAVVDLMREHGVLIGRTGPAGNVLKIRPPLAFETGHTGVLVEALRASLEQI